MKPRVFVVQPIPESTLESLRRVAEVEVYPYSDRQVTIDELTEAARRSDYIFTMHETIITKEVIAANPNLKGIVLWSWGEGEKLVDIEACERAGIPLLPHGEADRELARTLNAKATADLTVALLLCLAYRVVESDVYTRGGGFRQEMTMDLMGVGCPGKTVGVIGLGRVALELVPRLNALEMDVLYTKRNRLSTEEESSLNITFTDLDDLLTRSDYVCMMANYHPAAYKLMGEREFHLMKPTAYFVNTARGRLVDEEAMIKALQDGTIAGAGLDVYWNEPPVTHDPYVPPELRRLPNVVLAPHNGGATWDSRRRETTTVANAIIRAIESVPV